MKFRKKPVVIDAVRWDGSAHTANTFIGEDFGKDWWYDSASSPSITIPVLGGECRVEIGDYIIKGVKGEFYPCKPDIFAATHEPAE